MHVPGRRLDTDRRPLGRVEGIRRVRVIVDTDDENEADDQFAIVHALLMPTFDVCGIFPAHFGDRRIPHSQQDSREEVEPLLRLMDLEDRVRIEDGPRARCPTARRPRPRRARS